jgi:AraC-like DNA-binding protein
VAASNKIVSNKGQAGSAPPFDHNNPLTTRGIRLPAENAGLSFQVHECGAFVHKSDDWDYRQVVSPFWRLYCDAQPGCAVIYRGQRVELGPTRAVIIPEQVPFDCASRKGIPHFWIHFSIDYALGSTADAPLILDLDVPMQGVFSTLRHAMDVPAPRRGALAHLCAGALHLCIAQISEHIIPRPATPKLRTLLDFIDHVLDSGISNEILAARASLSPGAFLRWFRRETGVTPAAYVMGRRVREACRRLAFTDATIDDIASAVGFADRHHFSRVFKQRMGCGPAQFRKEPGASPVSRGRIA